MRQRFMVVGAVIVCGLVLMASVEARQRQNFSGHWVLSDQASTFDVQLGREFTITHTDAVILFDKNAAGVPTNPALLRIYYLNGGELKMTVPPAPPRPPGTSKGLITWGAEQIVWSAQWSSDQLVIVQKTTLTVTAPGREPPVERRLQTFTSGLSLDRDGNLVVNRATTVDPPTTIETPAPQRIIYKKG
jgi:hypothetical protein